MLPCAPVHDQANNLRRAVELGSKLLGISAPAVYPDIAATNLAHHVVSKVRLLRLVALGLAAGKHFVSGVIRVRTEVQMMRRYTT